MSFPLRRLPFLAISEVIKSMRTREIFLLSLASEKSANFVTLSIPKDSLLAKFTFREDGFQFELMPEVYIKQEVNIFHPVALRITEGKSEITGFSNCGLRVECEWFGTFDVEESIHKLFHRFSKLFKKSKNHMNFEFGTREEFAMEMMRFAWETGFPLERIDFNSDASPESMQELLNGCNEHTSLYIGTYLSKGFTCIPPPGGYKFKSFSVNYCDWVNPDDFLQCRELFLTTFPSSTMEYLNGLMKKIVNLECRIEHFALNLWNKPCDFAAIVEGLSESAIKRDGPREELQFERKDGQKLLISLYNGYYLRMTIV